MKEFIARMASGWRKDHSGGSRECNLTIGITTFEARFEQYFVPLLTRIREYELDAEIIVAVNGEHRQDFGERYRQDLLRFLSEQPKVFPVLFPRFRGLSKLWNTIIVHATYDHILMLNDDIMITDPHFMEEVTRAVRKNERRSFVINESWSHFLISRREIEEIGYFDERLLGIGEEDGDTSWRYLKEYGKPIRSFKIKGFTNYAQETADSHKPLNIKSRPGMKYSLFNREFIFGTKYEKDPFGIRGMFDEPMRMKDAGPTQYPDERFYREKRDEL